MAQPELFLRTRGDTASVVLLPLQRSPDGALHLQQPQQPQPASMAAAVVPRSQPILGDADDSTPPGVNLLQFYVTFLGCIAAAWLVFLLLPRGCRKAYFQRRRPTKSSQKSRHPPKPQYRDHPRNSEFTTEDEDDDDEWVNFTAQGSAYPRGAGSSIIGSGGSNFTAGSASVQDSILAATEARRRGDPQNNNSTTLWEDVPVTTTDTGPFRQPFGLAHSEADLENHETPDKMSHRSNHFSSLPSPEHPQVRPLPTEAVWRECYRRLQGKGMRLTAHGVQCPSKRIWLMYSSDETTLLWQTEFPRQIPTAANAASSSIIWTRGAMHRIPAGNILYIDVGKKTTALTQTATTVSPQTCFSLLTQAGSLDLQANSKLERDAIVSALSYILDIVHQNPDWRRLYEESSTIVNGARSTVPSEGGRFYNAASTAGVSNIESDMFV